MKIIELEQGSSEWIDWRKSKVTASELPIIMGKSPWLSPYELWQQKLGFTSGMKDNWAMQRGRDLEPIVRDLVNERIEANFVPMVVEHEELEWAAASLDGIDLELEAILEIKCPGLADHKLAEEGKVPEKYQDQIQWQLFCSGMKIAYYASYYNPAGNSEDPLVMFLVERDDDYMAKELVNKAAEFYKCVVDMIEPAMTESDYIQITDDDFEINSREWKAASEMLKFYKEKEAFYREKLISFTDDSNCRGFGLKIQRVKREGAVDWKEFWKRVQSVYPEVKETFDPEEFRKEQIGYWKISEEK